MCHVIVFKMLARAHRQHVAWKCSGLCTFFSEQHGVENPPLKRKTLLSKLEFIFLSIGQYSLSCKCIPLAIN